MKTLPIYSHPHFIGNAEVIGETIEAHFPLDDGEELMLEEGDS